MLLLLSPMALAFSDTIGGDAVSNDESDMLKLVAVQVQDAAYVQELGFAVSSRNATTEVIAVLYVGRGGTYELVDEVAASEPELGQIGWATASVGWLLEPGETYAIGAYVGEGWSYFYDERDTDSPWFGEVLGSYRVDDRDEIPPSFRGELEDYYYWMEVTSSDADADGDGFAASEFGGTDCDDTDPSAGAIGDEIPYDGIDQDCDGADMDDIDHDGEAGVEAGGPDCDDTAPGISSAAEEICGDGIDQDCSGEDAACGEDTDTGPDGDIDRGDPVDISPEGCGCTSAGSPAGLGAALGLVAALAVRRRR